MNWSNVTVFQYQQINELYANSKDLTDLDISVKVASILTNQTENQIDSLPVKELAPLLESIAFINEEIKPEAVKVLKINGRRYKCVYDVRNIPASRYIESKHFSNDVMGNLHKIMACMVIPQKRGCFGWKDERSASGFMHHYGWIYQTKLVADFEGITLDQAFNLPVINFLNDLAYLKAKMEHDNELIRKSYGKS